MGIALAGVAAWAEAVDALLASFVAVGLAEWGDKTQLLVLALVLRHGRAGPILAGVALGALLSGGLAALAGIVLNGFITLRAISLLLAVALLLAGVGGLIRPQQPELARPGTVSPFLVAAAGVFIAEIGDKSQFLTGAIAAQFDSFYMAGFGAAAGTVVACLPVVLLGDRFAALVPARAIRTVIACLFLLVGVVVAVNALRLI